jgi:uncharacterized phage protein (TIGR01671 family)
MKINDVKFRAFLDFKSFKVMLEEVTVHFTSAMVGMHEEAFLEVLESTDWRINDDEQFENKVTGEKYNHASVNVYNGDEYYFFENANVMLFSTLKDKNAVEIYEGDIIRYTMPTLKGDADVEFTEEVIFQDGCFNIDGCPLYVAVYTGTAEVVGNIHQNPDLLPPLEAPEAV